jgi:glycosyltransferase involved in cell wall biosynthesis
MLTVLLVARDASASLGEVLAAYERLVPPPGGWRLVVADNGSVDGTAAVVADASSRLPLTVVSDPRRGQNRARNRAMPFVEGDLLVLTDADAVPRPDWLVRLRTAADRHDGHDVFAGTVRPVFATPPPPWLLAAVRHGPTFARLERDRDEDVDPTEGLGPNLAIRVRALPPRPCFDETIGPDGTRDYAMGSETALLLRLARAGAKARYVRDAIVDHLLPPSLSTPEGVLERAFRFGRGRFRLGTVPAARDRLRIGGVPLRLVADRLGRRIALLRAGRDPVRSFRARWHLAFLAGQAYEARRARGATGGVPAPAPDACTPASARQTVRPAASD